MTTHGTVAILTLVGLTGFDHVEVGKHRAHRQRSEQRVGGAVT